MIFIEYLRVSVNTTINVIVYFLTFGKVIWLEGRVRGGLFRNWSRRISYRPGSFIQPTTEEEIIELVKGSRRLRVFGSGHSFNGGVVSDEVLVSLDRYKGVIWFDPEKKQMAVKGGSRIREIVKALLDEGLAFAALPSHDAQSIAGILSTDVHGTGRDWGFVSESVVGLKIIDGLGEIYEVGPKDDLFKAAIGGVGAVGIISEVVIQAVDRFNIEQVFQLAELSYVEENLDQLLAENEHFGLFLFPFTDKCQVNTWNSTEDEQSTLGSLREFGSNAIEALILSWFANGISYLKLLPRLASFSLGKKRGTNLVLESNEAHNRTMYPLHQEMEFAVPYEGSFTVCKRFLKLYEDLYPTGLPFVVFEIRFTPSGNDRTLIGAGRERASCWIDFICSDSAGFEQFYAAAGEVIREVGGRPHLGKWCEEITGEDLEKLHGEHFTHFLQLVEQHDPQGMFSNEFTHRLFGTGG
jgi:hypothetical protein